MDNTTKLEEIKELMADEAFTASQALAMWAWKKRVLERAELKCMVQKMELVGALKTAIAYINGIQKYEDRGEDESETLIDIREVIAKYSGGVA